MLKKGLVITHICTMYTYFLCGCTYCLEYPSFYNITKHTFKTYYIDHFHQSATIVQHCHTWPRLYHVNTTFTKLPPSCNVITGGNESTTSIHFTSMVNSTFTKLPPLYNVTHGHDSTSSIPLSRNCHHLATLSRTATNLPRQFHFHQTTTILQRQTWPRIYHVNTTFTKLPPSCHVMVTALPRQCQFHP